MNPSPDRFFAESTRAGRLSWLLPLLACAAWLGGCGHEHEHAPRGPVTTESRDVAKFDSIQLRGSAQLRVIVGEPQAVEIEAHQDVLKRLETEVSGGTLRIHTSKEGAFAGRGPLVITVKVPELTSLQLKGGNDVRVSGFDGGNVAIEIEGAANLKAAGQVDELKVHMSGAGRADLRSLVAKDGTVVVKGVGSVHVHATDSLDATMNGVGAILYSGSPRQVQTSMRGVGTISKDTDRSSDDEDEDWDVDVDPDLDPDPDPRNRIDLRSIEPEYEV